MESGKEAKIQISIFVTVGNVRQGPDEREDRWKEAVYSYMDLADEVVIVHGDRTPFKVAWPSKVKEVQLDWPYEWNWEELPMHMNLGLETCTGDWVLRMDSDYVIHEKEIEDIKKTLNEGSKCPIAWFQKYCYVCNNKYFEKGKIPLGINKGKVGNKYKFGYSTNVGTDMCYPVRVSGIRDNGVPEGEYLPDEAWHTRCHVWNYDYTFKNIKTTQEEFWRFSKAYKRSYGKWKMGATKEYSLEVFLAYKKKELAECPYTADINWHPKYIKDAISELTPEQFGHSGFGKL